MGTAPAIALVAQAIERVVAERDEHAAEIP
jgi:hypothetical protein